MIFLPKLMLHLHWFLLLIKLPIVFTSNRLVFKCITVSQSQKWHLQVLLCPTRSPKSKDSSFTVRNDKEQQQILTFMKLEPANLWHFCLKNDWNYQNSQQLIFWPTDCHSSTLLCLNSNHILTIPFAISGNLLYFSTVIFSVLESTDRAHFYSVGRFLEI